MEGANTNTAVLQTMGEAAKALKKAHADMDVDQVRSVCVHKSAILTQSDNSNHLNARLVRFQNGPIVS